MTEAAQTPILDLLRDVPEDARQVYEHDSMHSQNIPFGRIAREAADTIERLTAQVEDFCMDYRIKCDKETKAQAERIAELERLVIDAGIDDIYAMQRRDYADKVAQAAVPPGYALVPIEPTQEMVAAAMQECGGIGGGSCGEYRGVDGDDMHSVYSAMIAAAGDKP